MMLATLPRRQSDDVSGELMIAAYREALNQYPAEQIEFLRKEAIKRCKWFPTVAECIEIMDHWSRADKYRRRKWDAQAVLLRHKDAGHTPSEETVWKPKPGETAAIIAQAAKDLAP